MPDPTVNILQACFLGALGAFAISTLVRTLRARLRAGQPPPLPVGRVATWPYLPLDLVWMGFIFLTFFSLSVGSARLAAEKAETAINARALVVTIGFQLILAGMTVVVMAWRIGPAAWLGLRWPGWRWVFLIAPAGMGAMWVLGIALTVSGYMKWLKAMGVEEIQESVKLLQTTQDPLTLVLMAVAAVFTAPLCEEIVFRGYLYPAAKKFAGPWVAGACSALVFAAAHNSLAPLLPLFGFGCLLVLAYELTGSLWAPMAMHFCFNATTVILQVVARILDIPLIPDP